MASDFLPHQACRASQLKLRYEDVIIMERGALPSSLWGEIADADPIGRMPLMKKQNTPTL